MQVKAFLVLAILFRFSNSQINNLDSDIFKFPEDTIRYEKSTCTTSSGMKGVCERAENCPRKRFNLTTNDLCSFERNQAFYCCSDVVVDDEPISVIVKNTAENSSILGNLMTDIGFNNGTNDGNTTVSEESTTVKYYPEFWVNLYKSRYSGRPAINACTKHRSRLGWGTFVGGRRAFEDEHPYMTAIGWTDSTGTIDWSCGGVAIAFSFVLTAAHCTNKSGKPPDIVRVGDIDLVELNDTKFPPQDFRIRAITKHPDYDPLTLYNDIAIIEIDGEFNDTTPTCLWTNGTIPSTEALAMGYGTRSFAGPRSNILYQGNLTLVSNEECATRMRSSELPKGIPSSQICAHDPLQQVDTCQGDSGGPLLIYTGSVINTIPWIIGITSFGRFCASSIPTVYTRVDSYIDWIEKVALNGYDWTLIKRENNIDYNWENSRNAQKVTKVE